jgi:hypothetical protein
MPERAKVTSIEALEAFRSAIIIYLSKARPALDEVGGDVMRTRMWLEDEQRTHWENQHRRRARALQEAQAALFSSRLSTFRDASAAEQMAVHRAKRAFDEAEDKLRIIKKWNRDFENRVGPLLKQTEKLQTVLAHDMTQAIAFLTRAIDALHAYAGITPSGSTPGSPPPASSGAPGEPGLGGAGNGSSGFAGAGYE